MEYHGSVSVNVISYRNNAKKLYGESYHMCSRVLETFEIFYAKCCK